MMIKFFFFFLLLCAAHTVLFSDGNFWSQETEYSHFRLQVSELQRLNRTIPLHCQEHSVFTVSECKWGALAQQLWLAVWLVGCLAVPGLCAKQQLPLLPASAKQIKCAHKQIKLAGRHGCLFYRHTGERSHCHFCH